MPRRDPFTAMCQQAAGLSRRVVADLHLHTAASDGDFTPSQAAAMAFAAKLDAVAVTDHDTFAGVAPAVEAVAQFADRAPLIIPGVELTAEWNDREVHLLAHFPPGSDPRGSPLDDRLTAMCERRRERFRDYVRLCREAGAALDDRMVATVEASTASLGRRHVAGLLVRGGAATSRREAWQRFVGPLGPQVAPKLKVTIAEATELVHAAGGFTALAHPSPDVSESDLAKLKGQGMGGVEAVFPAAGAGRRAEMRTWANALGLIVTGGSDCHGAESDARRIGSCGLGVPEWAAMRAGWGGS